MIEEFGYGKYYLYRHIRPDKNEIFYIGIGRRRINRIDCSYGRAYSKNNRNSHWCNIVDINNGIYEVEILIESNNFDFIEQKEKEFIRLYGREDLGLGTLCNWTDGGGGIENISTDARNKMRKAKVGKPISNNCSEALKNYTIKNGNPFLGRHHSEETKNIIRDKLTGRKCRIEQLEKYRLTKVPISKRERIVDLLQKGLTYSEIVSELNTSYTVILKIKREYNVKDRYDFYIIQSDDGRKFYTEADACREMGVVKGTINKCIKKNYKCKGHYWSKLLNNESANKSES